MTTLRPAQDIAAISTRLATKLRGVAADMDPEQADRSLAAWPWLSELSQSQRAPLVLRLQLQQWGGLPPLEAFLEPSAEIALHPRAVLLRNLCTLALARRPGVVRCCVGKAARLALQQAVGGYFAHAQTFLGRAVDDRMAAWLPSQWACVGYLDWQRSCNPPHEAVRRVARLSLPLRVLEEFESLEPVPAELGTDEGLANLSRWNAQWAN